MQLSTNGATFNARHQRRARTAGSSKSRMKGTLDARPLHAPVRWRRQSKPRAPGIKNESRAATTRET